MSEQGAESLIIEDEDLGGSARVFFNQDGANGFVFVFSIVYFNSYENDKGLFRYERWLKAVAGM